MPDPDREDSSAFRRSEDVNGDKLEAEAETLVARYNDAKPDYSPQLEWFGMGLDHETKEQQFVLQSTEYIDRDGLSALRECGRTVRYIEAYEFDGEICIQIEVPVQGDVPDCSIDTGVEQ